MHSRRVIAGVAVVVAAVAAVVVVLATHGSAPRHPAAVAASVTATPAPSPTVSAAPIGPPHDVVAAAVPTRMRIRGPHFTIAATVCSMPWALTIDPPGEQHHTVCWVRNHMGTAPGSATGTSYLFGHSWAEDPQEVLNALSAPVTAQILTARPVRMSGRLIYPSHVLDGAVVTLWTGTGRLDYTVRRTFGVGKQDWGWLRQVHDATIGTRLVLTTCAERHGVDYPYNIVVEAYLTSSVSAAS